MKCLKCSADLNNSDKYCRRCGAALVGISSRSRLSDSRVIQRRGLQVFGCLGIVFLIGIGLCAVILPWRVARNWREGGDFQQTRLFRLDPNHLEQETRE